MKRFLIGGCAFALVAAGCQKGEDAPKAEAVDDSAEEAAVPAPPKAEPVPDEITGRPSIGGADDAEPGERSDRPKPGERVDRAIEATGEGLQVAGEKTEEGVRTAMEKTGDGLNKAAESTGRFLQRVGEDLERAARREAEEEPSE